jgi:hypothetical protein
MGNAKTIDSEALLDGFSRCLQEADVTAGTVSLKRGARGEAEVFMEASGQRAELRLPVRPFLYPSRRLLTEPELVRFLVLSPHLPEALAADLRAAGISHADLNGRLFIQASHLVIDRSPRSQQNRGPVGVVDVFSGKTCRLTRALLSVREKTWTQEELEARTEVSRGLVSRGLAWLVENDYVTSEATSHRQAARYHVKDHEALLSAWAAADDWTRRCEIHEFSVLSDDYLRNAERLHEALNGTELCFTQWIAAWLRRPHTTPPVVSAYLRDRTQLERAPGRKVDSGGNLWLIVPKDDGVFFETQEVQGLRLVTDVQIYLDLINTGQRGPEAAAELRKWEGFGR